MIELKEIYVKKSRIPDTFLKCNQLVVTTENDSRVFPKLKQIEDKVVRFVNEGRNLLIISNITGNGKTTWATRIGLSYIDKYAQDYAFENNTPVLFINVSEFLLQKKLSISNYNIRDEVNDVESSMLTAKIVIFDDIGTSFASDYDKELLYAWINYRNSHGLTSIFTSNVSGNDLESLLGHRIYSRIVNDSITFEITGKDMREVSK
jgi:DNA replication protein DnaC